MTTFDKGLDWLGKRIAERIRRAPKAADPMIHSDPALNLTDADREHVIGFMIERLGLQYDMRNVFDLARYLIPTPPVPAV